MGNKAAAAVCCSRLLVCTMGVAGLRWGSGRGSGGVVVVKMQSVHQKAIKLSYSVISETQLEEKTKNSEPSVKA